MQVIQGMLLIIGIVFANGVSAKSGEGLSCQGTAGTVPTGWITMKDPCIKKMEEQVQEELVAAMTYMAMGAYFSRDTVNRPGFAKMFFESASEEREHAIKIIEYLLMRGNQTSAISKLIREPVPKNAKWDDGLAALNEALELETGVTKKIRGIIEKCENPSPDTTTEIGSGESGNDFHLVDYLSGDFLDEQYKGQRDLAGKISTLSKMMESHGQLAEFLFDKKLLNGEPL